MTDTVDVDYYDLAEQIVRAQLERDELDAKISTLKGYFREGRTADYEREGRPTIIVKVTGNSRIDDKLAQEKLDPDVYVTVSKLSIDTAKARAFLPADTLASITKNYDNKVEVKLA